MALDEVSQFLEEYNTASSTPGFNGKDFTKSFQRGVTRSRVQPEEASSINNKGFIRETAEALGGGVADAGELWMRAVRALDPQGGNDIIRDFATFGIDSIRNFVARHPGLAPNDQVNEGVKRWWVEGVRALVPSLSASIPGVVVGGAFGNLPGAVVGSSALSGAIFGLAEFDKFNEEVEDRIKELGLSEAEATAIRQEARTPAIFSALTEGGLEAAANALQVKTLGKFLPGRKAIKNIAKQPIGRLFKKTAKQAVKDAGKTLALTTPVEVGTEFAQATLETKFRRDIGLTDLDAINQGFRAMGPAFVTNLLFFGLGRSANAAQRFSIRNSLEDAKVNPNKRLKAVRDIADTIRSMDDPGAVGIAEKLEASGRAFVISGLDIDLGTDIGIQNTLGAYVEGLQNDELTLDITKRLEKKFEEDLDRENLTVQDRVTAFQMFQGLRGINESFSEKEAIDKGIKVETVPTTEADKLEQVAEAAVNPRVKVKATKKVVVEKPLPEQLEDLGQEAVEPGTIEKEEKVTVEKVISDATERLHEEILPPKVEEPGLPRPFPAKIKTDEEKQAILANLKTLQASIEKEKKAEPEKAIKIEEIKPQSVIADIRKQIGEDATKEQFDELLADIEVKQREEEAAKLPKAKIDKKQIAQARKELKDPDLTPEDRVDLENILKDAGVPLVLAKKVKAVPKIEEPGRLDIKETPEGLKTLEKELARTTNLFVRGDIKDKPKAEAKNKILALRKQQTELRKKLDIEPVSVEQAKKNIKEKLSVGRISLGVDPTIAKDLGVVGTHHFNKGAKTFFAWAKRMIADFGEGVRNVLRKVFSNVKTEQALEQELARPEPIKKAVEPKRKFKPVPDKPRVFEAKDLGRKDLPQDVVQIINTKLGPKMKGETIGEKKDRWVSNLKLKIQQGAVDQYASLRVLDERLWKLAQLTTSASGAVENLLIQGPLKLTEGVPDVVDIKGGKGLFKILKPLGSELELFLSWIAGNRARELAKEGKERNLDADEISKLVKLNRGSMPDGRSRVQVYDSVRKKLNTLHQSVLDIAVETGTINKEERSTWNKDFYIPFFRFLEEKNETKGPKTLGGLTDQTAFKQLKGSDVPIADMLTNIILNWNHLIGASMKNQVAAKTLQLAENEKFKNGKNVATRIDIDLEIAKLQTGQFRVIDKESGKNRGTFDTQAEADAHMTQLKNLIAQRVAAKTSNTVFIRENGNKVWYEVNEPNIYQALTNLQWEGFNNRPMKIMRKFKRMLTFGVTASPEFKIRNLFRDTISSAATSNISLNLFDNVFGTGLKTQLPKSLSNARMRAGGGEIMFGHLYGTDPEKLEAQLKRNLRKEGIIDNPGALNKLKGQVVGLMDKWNDLGSKMENLNRGALFTQTLEKEGFLEANFSARDLLDFNRHGAWPAIRFLIDVVPFMNARIQGLDKLRRSFSDPGQRKRLSVVLAGVAMASMALYIAYKDDDEFKEREDWDRDTYWWFKLPGSDNAIRLPKPFEIGVIGTMTERILEQFIDDKAHGALFAERLGFAIRETFALGITPQVAKPVLELLTNRNFFTNRPIETLAMKNLSPLQRRKAWTSETAIGMSFLFSKIPWESVQLSPVQIEHLVQGYLGWVGATITGAVDQVFTQPLGGFPGRPSRRIEEFPLIGPFVRTTPSRQTKYATLFYEQLKDMNQTYADVRNFRTLGETEKALDLARKEKDTLRFRRFANKIQKNIAAYTKRIRLIRLDKDMPANEKRVKIDRLTVIKNRMLKMATEKIIT